MALQRVPGLDQYNPCSLTPRALGWLSDERTLKAKASPDGSLQLKEFDLLDNLAEIDGKCCF